MATLALLAGLFAAGCAHNDTTSDEASAPVTQGATPATQGATTAPQGATTAGNATSSAAGKAVFAAHNCANCHAVGGQGSGRAPDLSRVGADAGHTTEWLIAHVKNPKTHNPGSRMPPFEGKISDQDLSALGAYLASLK